VLEATRALLTPALARIEVATALVKKAQREEMPGEACAKALDLWQRTLAADRLVLVADEEDLEAACGLALDLGRPLPDRRYLALSVRLDAPLVTADRRFASRAGTGHPRIALLGQSAAAGPEVLRGTRGRGGAADCLGHGGRNRL
jgi:predicted nucleic acid-binding protein